MANTNEGSKASKTRKNYSGNKGSKNKRSSTNKDRDSGRVNNPKDSKKTETTKSTGGFSFSSPAIANIVNATSAIAVRNIAGNPISMPTPYRSADGTSTGTGEFTAAPPEFVLPGVIGIHWIPTIGSPRGKQTDPINLAARNIWMNLRGLYSNRIPYTAGAIIQYVLALDGIVTAYQYIKRAYGVIYAFDARNRYVPDALLTAMGIEPHDFRAHIPELRVMMNKLATQLNSFGIPADIRLILDHVDMTSHIYMDGTAANSMYLVPSPSFVWKMDWAKNELVPLQVASDTGTLKTFSEVKQMLETLVEAFVNNEDVYQIASDMMRLYQNLATIAPLDEAFMVSPEYDERFLELMHNATFPLGIDSTNACWKLTEMQAPDNVGAINAVYANTISLGTQPNASTLHAFSPGLFDFHVVDPSTMQIIDTANMKYFLSYVSVSKAKALQVRIESCGTILLNHFTYVTMEKDGQGKWGPKVYAIGLSGTDSISVSNDGLRVLSLWKDHTMIPQGQHKAVIGTDGASLTIAPTAPFADLDQYVKLDCDEIMRIHEAIMLDKFDAAGVGTLNLKAK